MAWGLIALTIPSFLSDLLLYFTIMKTDPLFYFRRCLALSLFSLTVLVLIFILVAPLSVLDPKFLFPDFALIVGLFAVIPPRALAVLSMSRIRLVGRAIYALFEPCVIVLTTIVVLGLSPSRMIAGLFLASVVGLTFALVLVVTIESNGRKVIGFSPIRMFRAFLTDWLEGRSHELETFLAELGVESEIDVTAFAFRNKRTKRFKAAMLVSNIHPGPFLNVGSSVMPFLFESLTRRQLDAVGLMPHGVSGHELNLVSQEQNERILSWVFSNLRNVTYNGLATPVDRSTNETATATSQLFDGCALVTMTTSPLDMEDVPTELAKNLSGLTHGRFRSIALIDGHNSLTGPATMTPQKIGALQEAALASLQVSAERAPASFKVGVAHGNLAGFTLQDGYGPAGISVLAIDVADHRFAYVCIDGNNMATGVRERILKQLDGLGFDDGEIMTTDTHMVNGVVRARLGYHPVGEVGGESSLLSEITLLCKEALGSLEEAEVGAVAGQIPVLTLGQKSLRHVMGVVYRTSKLTALTLFPMVVICTVLSLLFLV